MEIKISTLFLIIRVKNKSSKDIVTQGINYISFVLRMFWEAMRKREDSLEPKISNNYEAKEYSFFQMIFINGRL